MRFDRFIPALDVVQHWNASAPRGGPASFFRLDFRDARVPFVTPNSYLKQWRDKLNGTGELLSVMSGRRNWNNPIPEENPRPKLTDQSKAQRKPTVDGFQIWVKFNYGWTTPEKKTPPSSGSGPEQMV